MAEVVRTWNCGITGRITAELSHDFDPATDDVIVIKRDAARVWVEHAIAGSVYLHPHPPAFTGNCKKQWTSSGEMSIDVDGLFDAIPQFYVREFVAVKTHRPPVAQEVAEPVAEAVPEPRQVHNFGCGVEVVSGAVLAN